MIVATEVDRAVRGFGWRYLRPSGIAAFILAAALYSTNAVAAVLSTSGSVAEIAAPASVVLTALEHDSQARFFLERSSYVLTGSVWLDMTHSGTLAAAADLTPGAVVAGTRVNSFLLHADPIGSFPIKQYQGSITFDLPILGAAVSAERLNASDLIVGSPATTYIPRDPDSGFEGRGFRVSSPAVSDVLTISPDLHTISFHLRVESRLDQIRIITAAVPEPTSLFLLAVVSAATLYGHNRRGRSANGSPSL